MEFTKEDCSRTVIIKSEDTKEASIYLQIHAMLNLEDIFKTQGNTLTS